MSAIFSLSGMLPFVPTISNVSDEQYYCDDTYSGYGTNAEEFYETLTYDSYTSSLTKIDILCPNYHSSYGTNACTPTAGSIVTTYYDYYYPNLLPNYDPTYTYNNKLYWQPQNSTVNAMQQSLYNLMGTNTEAAGTSVAQFKAGMTSYYNTQGYSISYNNVTNSLTSSNVINYFNQEKPIILFLTSYEYFPSSCHNFGSNQMSMLGYRKTVGHAVVAFAYVEYDFYTNNEIFRTDKYLYVVFGDDTIGYLSINDTSYIQEAYTFNVA